MGVRARIGGAALAGALALGAGCGHAGRGSHAAPAESGATGAAAVRALPTTFTVTVKADGCPADKDFDVTTCPEKPAPARRGCARVPPNHPLTLKAEPSTAGFTLKFRDGNSPFAQKDPVEVKGKRTVTVRADARRGGEAETVYEFEILPLDPAKQCPAIDPQIIVN